MGARKLCWRCGTVAAAAIGLAVAARAINGGPILLHTPGVDECACGEWVSKTTRYVLWNPFRDRTPERAAETFLSHLRAGVCQEDTRWCRDAVARHRVSDWELAYREDGPADSSSLFFRLTKYDGGPGYALQGSGVVDVKRQNGVWKVVGYDAMF